MTDLEVISLIKEALHEVAPTRASEFENISLEQTIEDLSLDSIATMEMVGFLEDRVDSTFPDEELAKVRAVRDLAALIRGGRVGSA